MDVVSLWGTLIDIPPMHGDLPTYLPKVRCPNPQHDTTKHHFQVNTRKPVVHCFAHCGISGTYERAIAMIQGLKLANGELDERAARRIILQHSRVNLGVDKMMPEVNTGMRKTVGSESAVAEDEKNLLGMKYTFMPQHARDYLDARGIDANSRGKWQIGWDEEQERIVIPAYDENRRFRFLIRRRIDSVDYGKYLYTDGAIKTNVLFGACFVDPSALRSLGIVLVEGSIDTISMHQKSIPTATGILGTGISRRQARIIDKLNPSRAYLFFDGDGAGAQNVLIAKERIHKVPLFVCLYPKGKDDPAKMTSKEAIRSLDRAVSIAEFNRRIRGLTKLGGRKDGKNSNSPARTF